MHTHSQSMLNLHNIITNEITAKLKPFQVKIKNRKTFFWGFFCLSKMLLKKKLARDTKYVCSCALMMINELLFGEGRSAFGINIINFSHPVASL